MPSWPDSLFYPTDEAADKAQRFPNAETIQ